MDLRAAMDAIASFEGQAVCLDLIVARPAAGTRAGLAHSSPGILRRKHPSEFDEFWWTLPQAVYFECVPGCSVVVHKDRFRGAEWEGETLVIDTGAIMRRIVPMVRSDTLSPVRSLRAGWGRNRPSTSNSERPRKRFLLDPRPPPSSPP